MLKKFFISIIFLIVNSCTDIKKSQIIDNELNFYFKGQTNLYSEDNKKKIIKKFYEFSNNENQARQNVKKKCIKFVEINNLNKENCRYMGTKPTEKVLINIDQDFDGTIN